MKDYKVRVRIRVRSRVGIKVVGYSKRNLYLQNTKMLANFIGYFSLNYKRQDLDTLENYI